MGAGIMPCDPGTFELLNQGIERPKRMIITPSMFDHETPSAEGFSEAQTITLIRPVEPVVEKAPDAYELIKGRITELKASGATECTAADFEDLVQALGKDRTWIYNPILKRLVEEDLLVRQSGKGAKYMIVGASRKEL